MPGEFHRLWDTKVRRRTPGPLENIGIMQQYQQATEQTSSKKDFALLVIRNKWWGTPLFKLFDKRCSDFKDFLNLNKLDNGEYSHPFLDNLLEHLK